MVFGRSLETEEAFQQKTVIGGILGLDSSIPQDSKVFRFGKGSTGMKVPPKISLILNPKKVISFEYCCLITAVAL